MQSVLLKCPPYARFHFGKTGLDENSSLYQTSDMMHSDTLFSALMITCNKAFGKERTDELCTEIKDGKIAFSSVFYFLENAENRVFFLPKPDHFELLNANTKKRKDIRKVAFISKGVWEGGIRLEEWTDSEKCIILQGKFVLLVEELKELLGNIPDLFDTKQLKIFSIESAPKIADHARRRENNIFFQTDLHFAHNVINGQEISPHFYFLVQFNNAKCETLFKSVCDILTDEGIGGGISTGSGKLAGEGKAIFQNFSMNIEKSLEGVKTTLSLISPSSETELSNLSYYKILTRGGRPITWKKGRLERIKMLKEGALVKGDILGDIPKLDVFDKDGIKLTVDIPYYRNGKAFCLSIHENYKVKVDESRTA